MTNEDRLKEEVEMCHYHLLGKLADDAADRGLDALQKGYLWLRDNASGPIEMGMGGGIWMLLSICIKIPFVC